MNTVKVRIPVLVGDDGSWSACGSSTDTNFQKTANHSFMRDGLNSPYYVRHFIEAEVEIPTLDQGRTFEGTVE